MPKVYEDTGVGLEEIGIYCKNKKDSPADILTKKLSTFVKTYDYVKQIHGFYYDERKQSVNFDAVISFDDPNRRETFENIKNALKENFTEYTFNINLDIDLSD